MSVKIFCWINIRNVNVATKHIKHTTNTIYHLLVITTMEQIPEQSNILVAIGQYHLAKGEFEELYFKTIQVSLQNIQKPSSIAEILKKFKQCIAKGNINSALKNGVLTLNKYILQNLFRNIQRVRRLHKMSYEIVLYNIFILWSSNQLTMKWWER